MSPVTQQPGAQGQLVWCPSDPSLGIGVVTDVEHARVRVRFLRLQEDRIYTTRGAENVIMRYRIGAGEKVRFGEREHVRVVGPVGADEEGLLVYELEDGTEVPENQLVPEVRAVGAKARLGSLSLVHPEVVRARMQGLALATAWARPGMAGILGARALWLPHQIDVATRALESGTVRMLLADEVGLGKTVEAALIYAGLRYEGRANRVLILTPNQLSIQWLGEIFRKGHEILVLLDDERLDDAAQDFPDLSPFEAHQRVVMSIDRLASDPELSAQAAEAPWDLVIVDEAHHLRWDAKQGGNAKYRLLEAIAPNTEHLLLLTATPMALDPAEYHALLRLLDPARFDDPSSFERIRDRVRVIREVAKDLAGVVEVGKAVPKTLATAVADLLADDEEDADGFAKFVKLKPDHAGRAEAAESVLSALRHRHGLADYVVRNRRGPVGGMPDRKADISILAPTDDQQILIEVGESVMMEIAGTIEDPIERNRTLGRLLRALWATPRALTDILAPISPELVAQLAPHVAKVVGAPLDAEGLPTGDARLRWLVELLRRDQDDKVLVFVETDIAVRALRDSLESALGGKIAVFHRGLPPRDQDRQVAWFRDPDGPQVMLSTEAGGEGRNFQFCNRVVLYDMPWRPATVEQRIGRVDRVGQTRDVHVIVPCFKAGYEQAILKVMQESIGVLDQTVGGIDHALEYVSARLAGLILDGGGADDWKALFRETASLVTQTRERIEKAVDPILDHASFSPQRVDGLMRRVPAELEQVMERFIRRYAEHSRFDLHTKAGEVVAIEGAPGAAGSSDWNSAYVATFSRTHGLDHEDLEFLSFGHPLVEQALEWAREDDEASASLALCRGFDKDGAVFLWRFGMDLPDDVPEAAAFFDSQLYTFALDESGGRVRELDDLLDGERPLDRWDSGPLKQAQDRWQRLVDANYESAEDLARTATADAVEAAVARLDQAMARRRRDLRRQIQRQLTEMGPRAKGRGEIKKAGEQAEAGLAEERERLVTAIRGAQPQLMGAMAVRLVRAKTVSG